MFTQGDIVTYKGEQYRLLSDPAKTNALSLVPVNAAYVTLDNQVIALLSELTQGITKDDEPEVA